MRGSVEISPKRKIHTWHFILSTGPASKSCLLPNATTLRIASRKMTFGKARTAGFTIRADTRCSREEGDEYAASSFQSSRNS